MILHGTYCLVFLVLQSIGGESSFPLLVLNLVVLIWMECCRIKWHPTPWIGSPRSLETGKSIHQHFLMWKHFVKNTKVNFSWIGLSTKVWGFPLNFERFGNSSGGVELSLYEILSVCGRIGKIAQRTDTDPQNPSLNVILWTIFKQNRNDKFHPFDWEGIMLIILSVQYSLIHGDMKKNTRIILPCLVWHRTGWPLQSPICASELK